VEKRGRLLSTLEKSLTARVIKKREVVSRQKKKPSRHVLN
jgi:hypothetical protein